MNIGAEQLIIKDLKCIPEKVKTKNEYSFKQLKQGKSVMIHLKKKKNNKNKSHKQRGTKNK